jgi:hypothetical protein
LPVQVFVDDSGGKGQGRHFVLAGLLAHSDGWAVFSNEWRRYLEEPPRIRCFKMREAAACRGQFNGLSEQARDNKLRLLARVINRCAKICIYSAIDLQAHSETWAKRISKPFSEPYFFPFQNMILASCFELWDLGWRERFEIVFDEHVIFGPRVKKWYPVIQDIVKVREPESHGLMPSEPQFATDDECLPLQACDLYAWCFRKGSDIGADGRRPFEWLLEDLRQVQLSGYRQYYDRERLESVLSLSDEELKRIQAGDDTYANAISAHAHLFRDAGRQAPNRQRELRSERL